MEQFKEQFLTILYFEHLCSIKVIDIIHSKFSPILGDYLRHAYIRDGIHVTINDFYRVRNSLMSDGYVAECMIGNQAGYKLTFKAIWYMHRTLHATD
jgi:hypothetical protein